VVDCVFYAESGSWVVVVVVVKNRTGRGRQCTIGRGTSVFGWYCSLDLYRKELCSLHFRGNFEFSRSVEGHSVGCGSELGEGFILSTSLREGYCRNFALSFQRIMYLIFVSLYGI
jgi:hypothetical protein